MVNVKIEREKVISEKKEPSSIKQSDDNLSKDWRESEDKREL
jgi:hypothetical protein